MIEYDDLAEDRSVLSGYGGFTTTVSGVLCT